MSTRSTIFSSMQAVYIFDRGYVDFARLYRLHLRAFYVIRAKSNFVFKRLYSRPWTNQPGYGQIRSSP